MRFSVAVICPSLPLVAGSYLPGLQAIFANPSATNSRHDVAFRIPTVHESAVQARRVLHVETIGTLSTVFPSPSSQLGSMSLENRPSDVAGTPIGLMDYFADCEPTTGNPTILAIDIATTFKNVAAGSNVTLSLRWHPPDAHERRYSAASLPRFSLSGYLEDIKDEEVKKNSIAECFTTYHPDSSAWLPGNRIHESHWTRFVVQDAYWIGGFGDRAYIGWISSADWRNVTKEEVDRCRLPGEQ